MKYKKVKYEPAELATFELIAAPPKTLLDRRRHLEPCVGQVRGFPGSMNDPRPPGQPKQVANFTRPSTTKVPPPSGTTAGAEGEPEVVVVHAAAPPPPSARK